MATFLVYGVRLRLVLPGSGHSNVVHIIFLFSLFAGVLCNIRSVVFVFIPVLVESDMFRFRKGKNDADSAILKCALTLRREADSRGHFFCSF